MIRSRFPLVAALLACAACSRPAAVEGSAAVAEASALPTASRPAESSMRGWQQGQEYGYRFQTRSRIGLGDKTVLYDFVVTGSARLVTLVQSANAASFLLKLDGVEFKSRVPGTQADFDEVKGQLGEPYFFGLQGGLVRAASVPKDLHPLAAALFRSISASLQFAASDGSPRKFTATEFDTTGQYVAEYSPSSDPLVWRKQKQKYLGILLGENESKEAREVAPRVVASKGEIRLSPDGRPVQIEMSDELELANAQAPLRSTTTLSPTIRTSAIARWKS